MLPHCAFVDEIAFYGVTVISLKMRDVELAWSVYEGIANNCMRASFPNFILTRC